MGAVRDGDCALSEAQEAAVEIPGKIFKDGALTVVMGGGSGNSALG